MTQIEQSQQSTTSTTSVRSAAGMVRIGAVFVLIFGATALLVRCVGVATQPGGGHAAAHDPAAAARSGQVFTLEQLGEKAGCRPKVQIKVKDLRQGYCSIPTGRLFLTTFTTETGELAWVDQAKDYGLVLMGNRWVASGPPDVLRKLQPKVGGEIYGSVHTH